MHTTHVWEDLLANWSAYLIAAGQPSTTVGLRTYHLRRLAAAFPGGPDAVTFETLVEWLGSHGWKQSTRRSYRSSLRAFWGWAMASGRVVDSPAHLLPPVKVPRAVARPLPENAWRDALLITDRRAWLAIALAGMCGLRRGELARVRTEHVFADLDGWSLRVIGKGGHERNVPLPDDLAAAIRFANPGWLFPSSHGGHLTPHHLGKVISRHLPEGWTTHNLRHRCGTVAYAATRDLRAVQELLGHAKPETTAMYTAVPNASVRAAMRAAAA